MLRLGGEVMADIYDIASAVQAVLKAHKLASNDLSKKPSDLLAAPPDGIVQFLAMIQDCETEINKECHLNIAWPQQLPQQGGQPFAEVYFYKTLTELIAYFNAYINQQRPSV